MLIRANRIRDLWATGLILCGGLAMLAGGASLSKPPEDSGPIHAGATIESVPPKDVFEPGTNKVIDDPTTPVSSKPFIESNEPHQAEASFRSEDIAENHDIAADKKAENSKDTTSKSETVGRSKPVVAKQTETEHSFAEGSTSDNDDSKQTTVNPEPPTNPVEQEETPLQEMSKDEIKQRLADYRAWVHQGPIDIALDLSKLAALHIQDLVDFYVLDLDGTKYPIDRNGKRLPLDEIPPGQLVTDLNDDRHWPRFTRTLSGGGPKTINMAIVLNDSTELSLYRALVNDIEGQFPKAGTTVYIRITNSDRELIYRVLKTIPQQLTGKE